MAISKNTEEKARHVPFISKEWQEVLHAASTYTVIASYISSMVAPVITSPLLHRAGYTAVSTMQSAVTASTPPETFANPDAQKLKSTANFFALLAVGSGLTMGGAMAAYARGLGRNNKFVKFAADGPGGFGLTGFLNALGLTANIASAKEESDYTHTDNINCTNVLFPNHSKHTQAVVDATVPHMHTREAGFRIAGGACSALGSLFSIIGIKHPIFSAMSGQLFAWGLLLPSLPVGNEPKEKRFNRDINDHYLRINKVSESTFLTCAATTSIGLQAILLAKGKARSYNNPVFAWLAGKADNIAQIMSMGIACGYGYHPIYDTPAASRMLNSNNPRLAEQKETSSLLQQVISGRMLISDLPKGSYAERIASEMAHIEAGNHPRINGNGNGNGKHH